MHVCSCRILSRAHVGVKPGFLHSPAIFHARITWLPVAIFKISVEAFVSSAVDVSWLPSGWRKGIRKGCDDGVRARETWNLWREWVNNGHFDTMNCYTWLERNEGERKAWDRGCVRAGKTGVSTNSSRGREQRMDNRVKKREKGARSWWSVRCV